MDKDNVYVVSMPDSATEIYSNEDSLNTYITIPKDEIDSPKYRDLRYYARPIEDESKGLVYVVKAVPLVTEDQWFKKNIYKYDPKSNEPGYHVIPDNKMQLLHDNIINKEVPSLLAAVNDYLNKEGNTALVYFSSGTEHIHEKQELLKFDDFVEEVLQNKVSKESVMPELKQHTVVKRNSVAEHIFEREEPYDHDGNGNKDNQKKEEPTVQNPAKAEQEIARRTRELMTWELLKQILRENEEREELLEKAEKRKQEQEQELQEDSKDNKDKDKDDDELLPYINQYY